MWCVWIHTHSELDISMHMAKIYIENLYWWPSQTKPDNLWMEETKFYFYYYFTFGFRIKFKPWNFQNLFMDIHSSSHTHAHTLILYSIFFFPPLYSRSKSDGIVDIRHFYWIIFVLTVLNSHTFIIICFCFMSKILIWVKVIGNEHFFLLCHTHRLLYTIRLHKNRQSKFL